MRVLILLVSLLVSTTSFAKSSNGIYANLQTNKGDILIKLAYKRTPLTVINFVGLAEGTKQSNQPKGTPFYDGLKFHRVINNFMVQGGDPKGDGTGGPGYKFKDEITKLKHDSAGVLSMANSGKNTNGSQFFITHKATPWLDGKHTVFGKVVKGLAVLNSIEQDDIIQKIDIIRIGKRANTFETDETAFQVEAEKSEQKANDKASIDKKALKTLIFKDYPNAFLSDAGHFVDITQVGTGNKPSAGDLVKVRLKIALGDGTIMRKDNKILPFAVGTGAIIKLIDQSVLSMQVGEKRTLIATYSQIYGKLKRGKLPSDSLLIFTLELVSINDIN